MTIFTPDLLKSYVKDGRPLYLAIADAVADAIHSGALKPGSRLPTHRDLASDLGVTVGTITRAYQELERLGLTAGEVGRGTFVRSLQTVVEEFGTGHEPTSTVIDLRTNLAPLPEGENLQALMAQTLGNLARRPRMGALLGLDGSAELPEHQRAGAAWLAKCGLEVELGRVLLTHGAQHGLSVVLATIAREGDRVLTTPFTNPGIKAACSLLRLALEAIPADEQGPLPEGFDQACRSGQVRALYLNPTIQNPTGRTLSEERRAAVAAIARAHGVAIIEDDEYGPVPQGRPRPLAAWAPEVTYYLASLSKSLGFGLRLAYLAGPRGMERRILNAIRATTWMVSPLMAEIPASWLQDGTAERLIQGRRSEAARRHQLAAEVLQGLSVVGDPQGYHLWLKLPAPWRAERFTLELERRGVIVGSSEEFAVGIQAEQAVRLALGAAPNRTLLRQGLQMVVQLLQEGPGLAVM